MERTSNRNRHGKICAFGRIEVEEKIIGMFDVIEAVGPGIVVDATQAGQEKQGGAVVGSGVLNFLAAPFGIDPNGLEPIRDAFMHVFLKKSLAFNSVRVAA